MNSIKALVVVFLSALAAACATGPQVTTDYNPAYNFSSATKFAVVTPQFASTSPAASNDLLRNRFVSAIEGALRSRGYQIVRPAEADMLVSFFVTTESKTDIRTYNTGYSYHRCWSMACRGYATEVDVRQYDEGTLFIDFIDPASKQLEWRGEISKRLSKKKSIEERTKIVNEVVNAIIAEFPPAGG